MGDEDVLFDPLTWETHLLPAGAFLLLQDLLQVPGDARGAWLQLHYPQLSAAEAEAWIILARRLDGIALGPG